MSNSNINGDGRGESKSRQRPVTLLCKPTRELTPYWSKVQSIMVETHIPIIPIITLSLATSSGTRKCTICKKVILDRSVIVINSNYTVGDVVFHEECAKALKSGLIELFRV